MTGLSNPAICPGRESEQTLSFDKCELECLAERNHLILFSA